MQIQDAVQVENDFSPFATENAPVLVWMSGTDTLCYHFNQNWLNFTGRSLQQELGNGWAEGVHPDDLDRCLDIYLRAFEARQEFQMDYRLRRADGVYRWVVDSGIPRYSDNIFVGYIGTCVDITNFVNSREELKIRTSQQAVIAELGLLALSTSELLPLFQKTTELVSQILDLNYCSATKLLPEGKAVLIQAGYGWDDQIVGRTVVGVEPHSFPERTLQYRQPLIVADWSKETRFPPPTFLASYNIQSSLSIRLEGSHGQPYGTLVGHTLRQRTLSKEDVNFFQAAANVLSAAIQRKQFEEALQASEQRYRDLADAMPLPVWLAQVSYGSTYFNQRWFEYTGATFDQLKGNNWQSLVYPDDLPNVLNPVWDGDSIQLGQPVEIEYRLRRADGVYRWQLVRAIPQREPNTDEIIWIGANTDIDDRKRAEETNALLAEVSQLLMHALDYSIMLEKLAHLLVPRLAEWCAIDVTDENEQITRLAAAHQDATKTPLIYKLRELAPLEMDKPHPITRVLQSGQPILYPKTTHFNQEILQSTDNLAQIYQQLGFTSSMIVPLQARGRVIGAITLVKNALGFNYQQEDLTLADTLAQRVAVAIDNSRLYRESQRAVEVQKEIDYLKDLFVSIAGHELRTPLTSIRGYAQMLERGLMRQTAESSDAALPSSGLEKNQRALANIVRQTDRMNALINQLMDISRLQNAQFELTYRVGINLVELVQGTLENYRAANPDRTLVFQTQLENATGTWDEVRLEQVINNLVSNALKYSPANAPVIVGLELGATDQPSGELIVWVKDQGLGIGPDDQLQIFDRFYRTRAGKQQGVDGLGLGLYISHEIIIRHDGRMWLESQPGQGSTFYFSLPFPDLSDYKA